MTSEAIPTGGDARRLLDEAHALARRVRLAQRVTWLPLLVLAVVTFGAIPVYRWGPRVITACRTAGAGQACRVWLPAALVYWLVGLTLAYVVIAAGYLQVARARGLGTRIRPYAIAGVALIVLFTAIALVWSRVAPPSFASEPSAAVRVLYRLVDWTGAIGMALLVLAWVERHVALLLFALAYLAVVLIPINFGWGVGWGGRWGAAPMLVITGGLLLLGGAGFALAQRRRHPR